MARLLSDSDRKPKPKRVVVSKADVTVALGDGDELSDDYIITVRQEHELVRVLLQSPETLLFGRIRPTMLEARDYHYIWVAMENLAQRTGAIAYDRAAVAAEMERIEPQAFRGKYVERLLADIEMEGPVCPDYYVEKVLIHEKVVRHNLKHFRQLTQKLNDKAEVDGGVLVYDEYITAAGDIARTPGVGMPIESVGRRLRHWDPDAAAAKIIPSGHAVIDQVSGGGPSKGDLVVIGGGTNAGKSYMGEELLRSHKDMDSKFLVISVEDDEDLMYCRLMARETHNSKPPQRPAWFRKKPKEETDYDASILEFGRKKLEPDEHMHVRRVRKGKVSEIIEVMRRYVFEVGIKAAMVDYLQAVQPDYETKGSPNITQETAKKVTQLKSAAEALGIPIYLTSQLSREEFKHGQEPDLTSCKYAGDIENETELLVLLWRTPERVLKGKVAKAKWMETKSARYIVQTHPVTGCFVRWEADFQQAQAASSSGPAGDYRRGRPRRDARQF